MRQYKELGVFTESGGFEIARTEERMEELRRRMSSGARPGASRPSWSAPEFVKEKVPFLETDQIIGAFWTAERRRRGLAAGRHAHARARAASRCAHRRTERRGDRPRRRGRPDPARPHRPGATSRPSTVVIACGVWSPKIGDMAGISDPADPRRPPDDQRRPLPAARRARGRDLVPDRARHGHLLLRAPARRRHGGRLLRAPRDPDGARGDPLDRAGEACRRPSCRSPPTTSTPSSSRPTS